jgi:hypothetical protein
MASGMLMALVKETRIAPIKRVYASPILFVKNDQKSLGSGLNSFREIRKIKEKRFNRDRDKNLGPLESKAPRFGVITVISA